MTSNAKAALKYLSLAVTIIAGAGPFVAQLAGVAPPTWLAVASHIVAIAGTVHQLLVESPLAQPLLASKDPLAVIDAAEAQAVKLQKPPVLPTRIAPKDPT